MNDTAYDDITAEGRLAALTVALLLVLTGLGIAGASWDDVWERCGQIAGECVSRASSAMLLVAISVVMVGFGIVAPGVSVDVPSTPTGARRGCGASGRCSPSRAS